MTTINAFIKRYSVTIYFVLAFALSWGSVILVLGGIPGPRTGSEELLPLSMLAMYVGPSVAGLLLTGLVSGKAGFRDLRSRLLKWRVGARWYAVALLVGPLSVIVSLFVLSIFSPEFVPDIFTMGNKVSPLLFGIVAGLVTSFFEELGWTGFALPQMRQRYSILVTGLILGFIWGAWHFLVTFWGSESDASGLSLALFIPAVLFSFMPAYRLLMVWVYDRTGSILIAMLMHASMLTFWLTFTPESITGGTLVTWYLIWAAILWIVVAAVSMAGKTKHLNSLELQTTHEN